MRRRTMILFGCVGLLLFLLPVSLLGEPDVGKSEIDGEEACATGCGGKDHHPIPPITESRIEQLLRELSLTPVGSDSLTLDTLLFHGEQVRDYLNENFVTPLPGAWEERLLRELSRTHATVTLRLIDEEGVVRAQTDDLRVPLNVKQHIPATKRIRFQPCEFNGTVKRVGRDRIWARY